MYAYGTGEAITVLIQQLAWITAVCRNSKEGCLLPSEVSIRQFPETKELQIEAMPLETSKEARGHCWHSMFAGYILAYDFPIPNR